MRFSLHRMRRPPSLSVLTYENQVRTLKNGLRVVTVAMPHLHSAQVAVFARVGSRHERPETNGLSHFLEHMIFRGCDGFEDSTALNAAMEDLGGYLDGFTTRDYSAFQSTVHPRHIGEATEILSQMFRAPKFQSIDIERQIILEEMLDALDDRGRQIELDVIAHQLAFEGHSLAQSIDGPRKNVRRFSIEDLHSHRAAFYGAKNLVLCFAGAVDAKECHKIAARTFGKLFDGQVAKEGRAPALPASPARARFVQSDDSQTRCRMSFRTVSDVHADYPALLLLRRVLDGGLSARLQVELVEKRGIAYEVGADFEVYSDCGMLDFEIAVAHRKLSYALTELGKVLADLRNDGVSQQELDRVRHRARISLEMGLDSPGELAHWFGANRLFHEPATPAARMAGLELVTVNDVRRIAKKYLHPKRLTLAAVGGADRPVVAGAKRALKDVVVKLS